MDIHAHVNSYATDCDGPISRSYFLLPNDKEIASEFGDIHFHDRVVAHVVNTYSILLGGTLRVTKHDDGVIGLDWSEATDEGGRDITVRICEKTTCDTGVTTYRDHRAEAAGY